MYCQYCITVLVYNIIYSIIIIITSATQKSGELRVTSL